MAAPMSTPLRRQYLEIKRQHPDAILLFRLGDFYETFDGDAEIAARELDIVLTGREMGNGERVPLAGIPYHAAEGYIARLVTRGYKVAICDQLGDPSASKGLVERAVVRVVTPGTVVEAGLLSAKANNYLAALAAEGKRAGLAYVDITTGEFAATQLSFERALAELERLQPAELLLSEGQDVPTPAARARTVQPAWRFRPDTGLEALLAHFEVATLDGFGLVGQPLAVAAAGAVLQYLQETQPGALARLGGLTSYSTEAFMVLDAATRRNLDLAQGPDGSAARSLLGVLDLTETAMGGRKLRRWITQPLLDLKRLQRRQEAVAALARSARPRAALRAALREVPDLERLALRVAGNLAGPRELAALARGLAKLPAIQEELGQLHADEDGTPAPAELGDGLDPCPEVVTLIAAALVDDPPATLNEGGAIRPGFSEELDSVLAASGDARAYVAGLERTERERTGIKSLRVGFNKVFGYYIEVSNANLAQVPNDYLRKQTLVGAERFLTPALKEQEAIILHAQDRRVELEKALFRRLCGQVAGARARILRGAGVLARLDALAALAEAAVRYDYVRPKLNDRDRLQIRNGRHPVVERFLEGERFVPNDTSLASGDCQIMILTGPNMAGKSTYLRQVALIVLMAQIGSFVPASAATVGLVDRIFTRVGAHDELAAGRSTFMVEMVETANILHHATARSLVILDEIGRGTSTYDGLSIARAVIEYLHNHPRLAAKTLFATHYHELVELERLLPRVRNYNVAVAEDGNRVTFLRRILPGGADRSYGIHVAQMAGLPRAVIHRAGEILAELEAAPRNHVPPAGAASQMALFSPPEVLTELAGLDITCLTPLEAITKLYEFQQAARNGQT
jgi:DNA mismatch repair protein MutS